MFESDAKMLAGKEKREMEALFGKKAPVSAASTTKKFEPSGSSGQLPSMFASGGGASGTLMSSGSAATMKVDKGVYDSATGGAKAAGKPVDRGGVSKLNMGSAGVMDTSRSSAVDVANRGKFAGSASSGSVSKLNMGSAGVMDTSRSAHVDVANRGKFGSTGTSSSSSTVSKLNMGSAGVMDTSRSKPVTEANRASFGAKPSPSSSAGATKTVSRDPMSQNGVLRKFAWEQ